MLYRLDFFAANDVNGDVLATFTDEDDVIESIVISPRLRDLGGGSIHLRRDLGAGIDRAIIGPEAFVRFVVPSIHATKYVWGMFINQRDQTLVSARERAGEGFFISGLGPKFYLDRAMLWAQEFGSEAGIEADPDNRVFNVNDNINIGALWVRLLAEDAANTHATFLPDLTLGFDATNDSAGSAWTPNYQLGENFTMEMGVSYLQHLFDTQEACKDEFPVEFIMDLGEIGTPLLQLDARKNYGRDLTGTAFGSGVVLLREGVNLVGELRRSDFGWGNKRQASGNATRKASHVLVMGEGNFGSAVLSSYDPGDYAKAVAIDAGNYSSETVLDRRGERFLRHQENGDNEFALQIVPGFDESAGHYFPGPGSTNGHVWPGDTVTLKTGQTVSSALEYEFADEWVTGLDLKLRDAARDDTTTQAARSWDLTLHLNQERGSDNRRVPEGGGGGGSGKHRHPPNPKLCARAIDCPDLTADHLTAGTATNGDAEAGASTQWTGGTASGTHRHAGSGGIAIASTTDGTIVYTWDAAQEFIKGTRYVLDVWKKGTGTHVANDLRFGVPGGDEESSVDGGNLGTETGADGATWALHRICWTPTADRTGVRFSYREQQSSGVFALDDLALYTTDNNELAGTSPRAARCDHAHHARDIVLRPPPGMSATDVQAFADEIAEGGAPAGGPHSHPGVCERAFGISAAPNGGWNRNLQPRAIHFQGWLYMSTVLGTTGDVIVSALEDGTDSSTVVHRVVHAAAETDDHAAGVLAVRDSDHKLMFWHSGHGSAYLHQAISTTSLDTDPDLSDGFAAETNLDASLGGTAYTHISVAKFTDGDLRLMFRDVSGSDIDWKFSDSTNGGSTWAAATSFYNSSDNAVHVTCVQTAADRIDFLATTENPLTGPSSLVHFSYDRAADDFLTTAGSVIASLPVTPATATEVWDGSVASAFNYDVKLDVDGAVVVGFVVFEDIDTDHRAYWGRWSGTEFENHEIIAQGGPIGDGSDPAQGGGLVLDWLEPTTAYVGVQVDGVFEVFECSTPDGGPSWNNRAMTENSTDDNFRPYAVQDFGEGPRVLWPAGEYTNLDDFNLGMWGAGCEATGTSLAPGTAVGDRLRWDGSEWAPTDLIWRPVMAQDPSDGRWLVVVDGGGTAVMAEG